MLCSLIYLSSIGTPENPELRDLDQQRILTSSKLNNARNNITGVLALVDGYFLQYLEGDRRHLTQTFGRISSDQRHHNVMLVSFTEIIQRQFPTWGLEEANISDSGSALVRSFTSGRQFEPGLLSAEAIFTMIREIYEDRRNAAKGNSFLLDAL